MSRFNAVAIAGIVFLLMAISGQMAWSAAQVGAVLYADSGVYGPQDGPFLESPYSGGSFQYTGQLHTHAEGTGGSDPPSVVEETYRDLGYDFVALTGHNAFVPDPGVVGILHISKSEEHVPDYGHIAAAGLQTLIPLDADAQQAIDHVNTEDGFASLAHPNFSGASWDDTELTTLIGYHAIEIKNGYVIHQEGVANGTALSEWDMLLSNDRRVWGVGVDDAHSMEVGGGIVDSYAVRVFSDLSAADQEDLISGLKDGNFYAVTGADGPVVEQVGTVGDTIDLVLADVASTYTVYWYGNDGTLLQTDNSVDSGASYTADGAENYIRAEIVRDSDGERAWLNPIFISGSPPPPTDTPTPTNEPPEAKDDTASTDEDTLLSIDVLDNDQDPEGMPLTVEAVGTPNLGGANTDGTTVTYTPANRTADYTAVFTYMASDGDLSDTATVTVNVSADNDAPDAVNDLRSTTEESAQTIPVLSNDSDPEGTPLTVVAVGMPNLGTATMNGTTITYTPVNRLADYTAVFTYTASDGDVSDTATVIVDVSADNDPPEAVGDTDSTDEGTPVIIAVLGNDQDPEGAPLSVAAVGTPNLGSASTDGTAVMYMPVNRTADYAAVFTYTASDGGATDTATVTVYVAADNDPPNAEDDTESTDEETAVTIAVLGNDSDADRDGMLAVGVVGMPNLGTATTNGTTITYAPANRLTGYTAVFTYTASDGELSDTATVRVMVSADNDPPDAVNDTRSTDEDTAKTVSVLNNDSDPEGMPLTVVAVGMPGVGTASTNGTAVTYTPVNRSADYAAVFTYTTSDGSLSDTATVTLFVSADNDPPGVVDDLWVTDEDTPITIYVLSNDADPDTDDTLSVQAVGTANLGSASTDGTTVAYVPSNQAAGYTAVFTYTASDGELSDTATVTVIVSGSNDPPEAEDDIDGTDEETPVTISVLDNDSDPDSALFVAAVGTPDVGGTSTDGSTVTYRPANRLTDYSAVFTYTASDGDLTDMATVTVVVRADNDAPVAEDDTAGTAEEASVTVSVLGNDEDPEGLLLTVTEVGMPNLGNASTDGTVLTYTPVNRLSDYTAVLTYAVSDGDLRDTATVMVGVSADNDAPTVSYILDQSTRVGVTLGPIPFSIGDAESPAESLTVWAESSNQALVPDGNIALGGIGADRTMTITPVVGLVETATITVTVNDGERTASEAFELKTVPSKLYLPVICSYYTP
jgi:hypothetical protein